MSIGRKMHQEKRRCNPIVTAKEKCAKCRGIRKMVADRKTLEFSFVLPDECTSHGRCETEMMVDVEIENLLRARHLMP